MVGRIEGGASYDIKCLLVPTHSLHPYALALLEGWWRVYRVVGVICVAESAYLFPCAHLHPLTSLCLYSCPSTCYHTLVPTYSLVPACILVTTHAFTPTITLVPACTLVPTALVKLSPPDFLNFVTLLTVNVLTFLHLLKT